MSSGQQAEIDALIGKWSGNTTVAQNATEALAAIGEPATPSLIAALNSKKYLWAERAEDALLFMGAPAVPALIALCGAPNAPQQERIVKLLIQSRDARAVPALIACLPFQPEYVQREIVGVMGVMGGDAALELLLQMLQHSDDAFRSDAAQSLGELGDRRAFDALLRATTEDTQETVRCFAWDSLGKLGDVRALEPMMAACAVDTGSYSARSAAEALGVLGDLQAVPMLLRLLRGKNVEMRRSAARALGRLDASAAREALDAADAWVRYFALEGVAASHLPQKLDWGLEFLIDRNASVSQMAETLLVGVGTPAVASLIPLLSHPKTDTRRRIAHMLGRIGDASAAQPLVDAWGDKSSVAREAVTDALRQLGASAIPALALCLRHSDAGLRQRAANRLVDNSINAYLAYDHQGLPGRDAPELAPLRSLEQDPDARVRSRAVALLLRLERTVADIQAYWQQQLQANGQPEQHGGAA